MVLVFDSAVLRRPGHDLTLDWAVAGGVFVGLLARNGSGAEAILRLAAGSLEVDAGRVEGTGCVLAEATLTATDPGEIRASVTDALALGPKMLLLGPTLALLDGASLSSLMLEVHGFQQAGGSVVFHAHDLALLERHADEIATLEGGRLTKPIEPRLALEHYKRSLVGIAAEGAAASAQASSRHGDRRIEVDDVRVVDFEGGTVAVIPSGARFAVEVDLRAIESVAAPVVGLMIRSRVGVTVYGTNTELEGVTLGPTEAGESFRVRFEMNCDLCPGEYTVTVASHDADGTPHDWLEDARLFAVEDTRYTAGVANLKAQVRAEPLPAGLPRSD